MPHGMVETPHGIDFSFLFRPSLQQLQLQLHTDNGRPLSVTCPVQACPQQILLIRKSSPDHLPVCLRAAVSACLYLQLQHKCRLSNCLLHHHRFVAASTGTHTVYVEVT